MRVVRDVKVVRVGDEVVWVVRVRDEVVWVVWGVRDVRL